VNDILLIEASKWMYNSIRKDDIIFRLGGDKFTVIVTQFEELADLYEII
jgi:GGDEF domain-containing protein